MGLPLSHLVEPITEGTMSLECGLDVLDAAWTSGCLPFLPSKVPI